ncbi:Tricorn protease [Usitatibacter rugosus]|uniref:Tricorn protease homolog n=1 Tax=Usitatibacter rugosus TaxID=2732067 RepID=A0A6M4H1B2_9PROT|nr:S41 family peptidase [Usitatibacter rugosus]QJR12928.1 Tricorn protease [Usitatibacter rugosus]
MRTLAVVLAVLAATPSLAAYFRQPAINGDTVVFVAEGDLWRTTLAGGDAQRLTSHPGTESTPAISPDGRWVAFSASYEGPTEAYVMPIGGGLPKRLTWYGDRADVVGWNGNGEVLVTTRYLHGLRKLRLAAVSIDKATVRPIALEEGGAATTLADGTLVFTQGDRKGDNVRNYRGGATTTLWKFREGAEATALTRPDANSSNPQAWRDRIVFLSDRNGGVMNLWSMNASGGDLRQHTRHTDFEVRAYSVSGDRAVYQQGADLHVLELAAGGDRLLAPRLLSDFDQQRERWVRPMERFATVALSSNGDRIAIVARGAVATAGIGALRRVDIDLPPGARARSAEIMPDGKSVLVIADASGETELWLFPADGSGPGKQLTKNADGTRLDATPSPDGKWIAHHDRRQRLWLLEVSSGRDRLVDERKDQSGQSFANLAWAPDSSAFAAERAIGRAGITQVVIYRTSDLKAFPVASTRYPSTRPSFSPDGKWFWFIGNRNFEALASGPWGDRNMGPYFDKRSRVYAIALQPGNRFPFQPRDELEALKPEPEKADPTKPAPVRVEPPKTEPSKAEPAKGLAEGQDPAPPTPGPVPPATPGAAPAKGSPGEPPRPVTPPKVPAIAWDGLEKRVYEVPLPAGNYTGLASDGKRLWYLEADTTPEAKATLKSVPIDNTGASPEVWSADVRQFVISTDAKKLFVRKWAAGGQAGDMYIVDPTPRPPTELPKFQVRLADWQFSVLPREEWNGMFADAWRMHRDWFYDSKLKGVDWKAMRAKYGALLPRVTDREELADLLSQMMAELSLLHSQSRGGDLRRGTDAINPASLGATYEKAADGTVRIAKLYRADPDLLNDLPPLSRTEVSAKEGDILVAIDGRPVREVSDVHAMLRDRAGKQVLVELRTPGSAPRKTIATPVPFARESEMKRRDYEWRVRDKVEAESKGRFGYLYLRAMGPNDLASFAREYYPSIDREGLIIDVRGNGGGNIDSILIEKLMRRVWAWWRTPSGGTFSNMQAAFRGHVVVLIDEGTYSDGETFAEGIKRLGIGTVIGKRTAGAGVWLTDSNGLIDGGGVRAAEFGQFTPDGAWIIEGTGVTPDIEVDNPPNATYRGEDAQLAAAIRVLEQKLKEKPYPAPVIPR